MVSRVRVRFTVKVTLRNLYLCVKGLKCPRTEHQFRPIYPTEIITIVQCMSFGMVGQVGWWVTSLMAVGGDGYPPTGRGKFVDD